MKKLLLSLALVVLVVGTASASLASDPSLYAAYTWVSVKDGDWQDATTWRKVVVGADGSISLVQEGYPGQNGDPLTERVLVQHALFFYSSVYFSSYIEIRERSGEACTNYAKELSRGYQSCTLLAGLYFVKRPADNTTNPKTREENGRLEMRAGSTVVFGSNTAVEAYSYEPNTSLAANQFTIGGTTINGQQINALPVPLGIDVTITESFLDCVGDLWNHPFSPAELYAAIQACIGPTPQPVELTEFTARAVGHTVELGWKSLKEWGFSHYLLQWSTDAVHFVEAGTVEARGTQNGAQAYRFEHQPKLSGTLYYRLLAVDVDGTVADKGIRVVRLGAEVFRAIITNDHLLIDYNGPADSKVMLYDLSGKLLRVQASTVEGVETRGLSTGVYLLQVSNALEKKTVRVLIQQ